MTEADQPEPMVPAPTQGRIFSIHRRPQLGDCAPSGRVRLDALARWMQDVAFADVEEAGLERVAIWVLRRHRIRVARFPQFGERCTVQTFCSGIGRMWAERRTTIAPVGASAIDVDAVSLWVHLDRIEIRRFCVSVDRQKKTDDRRGDRAVMRSPAEKIT